MAKAKGKQRDLISLPLSHFSSEPVINMYERKQTSAQDMKPTGLWVSVDGEDDWPSWCLAESFCRNDDLRFRHRVVLRPDNRVLLLSDKQALRWFGNKYRPDPTTDPLRKAGIRSTLQLDWFRAIDDCDGLVIHPYCWECRLDPEFAWYYGWDCASGCIWHPRAVESITMVERTDLPDRIMAARLERDAETDRYLAEHQPQTEEERKRWELIRRLRDAARQNRRIDHG